METFTRLGTQLFKIFLSERTRERIERFILILALLSFLIHLVLIYLIKFDVIAISEEAGLLTNPISAVYTPFSFILIYEVYLLIFYLPKSFTTYVVKQYEIITLIIIRRLFKDLSGLELTSNWFDIKGDLQFTYDLLASLLLFYLIYQFQKQGKRKLSAGIKSNMNIETFVKIKRLLAVILLPLFCLMAIVTLIQWSSGLSIGTNYISFEDINNLFFDDFFTVLILVDVVLLLISFFYTDKFHKIIRNSGFIVSTILIRMSFGVTGLINTALILVAVLFGLAIIIIHNQYEKSAPEST